MLLTPIGTGKHAGSRLRQTTVLVGVNVLHAFIDKIQINLMPGINGRARKAMNGLGTAV